MSDVFSAMFQIRNWKLKLLTSNTYQHTVQFFVTSLCLVSSSSVNQGEFIGKMGYWEGWITSLNPPQKRMIWIFHSHSFWRWFQRFWMGISKNFESELLLNYGGKFRYIRFNELRQDQWAPLSKYGVPLAHLARALPHVPSSWLPLRITSPACPKIC